MTKQKLILDLDTGIDDAMAIAYALSQPNADILAVTSVFGNAETDYTTPNASAILKLLGREDIPVYAGARRALGASRDYVQEPDSKTFHGRNGLANLTLKAGDNIKEESASDFLVEAARHYGQDLIIVSTGPLTNIALAIQQDKDAMLNIKRLVSMGGALTVPGNVSAFAEANFDKDVQADNIVFSSGIPMTMVGLDVTLRTLLTERDIAPWKQSSGAGQFFFDLVSYYFHAYDSSYSDLAGCALHDPLAVAVALNPDFVSGADFCLKALDGDQHGRIVQDQEGLSQGQDKNVYVALDVDKEGFEKHFINALNQILL